MHRRAARTGDASCAHTSRNANCFSPSANRSASRPGTPGSMGDEGGGTPLQPSQLGYFGGLFSSFGSSSNKDDVATFDREPPRNSLTAPPSGYQTPSAAQPYGITKKDPKLTVTPVDRAVGY